MHKCEFYHIEFSPRPQVKNPRACKLDQCQVKRQRSNEKAWKDKHSQEYDKEYHETQRDKRSRAIEMVLDTILKCLDIGSKLTGKSIQINDFKAYFTTFLFKLGLRRINKFWNTENTLNNEGLSS